MAAAGRSVSKRKRRPSKENKVTSYVSRDDPDSEFHNQNDTENKRKKRRHKRRRPNTHYSSDKPDQRSSHRYQTRLQTARLQADSGYTHLVAFDFDQTLSCVQVFNAGGRDALELFGGKPRVQLIDRFLHYLKQETVRRGFSCRIVIISYNFTNVIIKRLKQLRLFGHFEHVYDRDCVNKHGGFSKGKGNLLRSLAKKWDVDYNENTVLIDDCSDVVWHTRCQTVHVSKCRGMYKYEMQQICDILNVRTPHFVSSDTRSATQNRRSN